MSLHIIAVHGAGMNAQVWGGMTPLLAAAGYGAAFQGVNLPGHRDGDAAAPLTDMSAMSAWLHDKINDVPQDRDIVLMGHSMGAAICLTAAANHPRVRAVVAVATAGRMPVNAELLALAASDAPAARALIIKWSCDPKHAQADAVRHVVTQLMEKTPPAALATDLAVCNALQGLPACGKPVLVVSGRFDKMTPPEQGRLLAEAQGGQYVAIDCGHMIPCEAAPQATAAITAFLEQL